MYQKINGKYIVNTTGSKYNINPVNRLNSPFEVFNKNDKLNLKLNKALICAIHALKPIFYIVILMQIFLR